MKKIKLLIELKYDQKMWHTDEDEKDWFFNTVLNGDNGQLLLHSNDVGDQVGEVRVLKVEKKPA